MGILLKMQSSPLFYDLIPKNDTERGKASVDDAAGDVKGLNPKGFRTGSR